MENIPEEILREWIDKAKPLVDSAWNLALDKAISIVQEYRKSGYDHHALGAIIDRLYKLKKETNANTKTN